MKKISIRLIEDHDQAYYFWKRLGLSKRPLIHFDAHIDFGFLPIKPLQQAFEEAESKRGLLRQLSRNLLYKQLNIKEESLTNIGNYIYPAIRDGIVSDFYWVIPGDRREFKRSFEKVRSILKSSFRREPFRMRRIAKEKGFLSAKVDGRNFIVTTLQDLPENITGAIVDIDCDYLTTDTIRRAGPGRNIGRRFPWIWPEELAGRLKKKKIDPCCMTIAYSVNGGFTPVIYKFLGDEVTIFFNGTNRRLKEIISAKNEAFLSFQKGDIKEAVDRLKEVLRNLKTLRINHSLKNRLVAHLAFALFRCMVKINNTAQAGSYYNLAISSDATYRVKDNNYGPLYLRKRGLRKAEREFKIILSVDRGNSYALCGLANIFMKRRDFEKAKALFKGAHLVDKKNINALLGLSRAELFLKDYQSALKHLLNYKSKKRAGRTAHFLLARAYQGLGRFDEALQAYRAAHRFGPGPGLYRGFFQLLKKTGIPERHREWIEGIIITYKNYRKRLLRFEEKRFRGPGRRDRIKRSFLGIDKILTEIQEG